MKRYKFLIKPLFYIFSLTASSYLVIVIEKVSPSDFGKHQSIFVSSPNPALTGKLAKSDYTKEYLKNICFDYKYGIIDSSTLDARLSTFLYGIEPKDTAPQMASVNTPTRILLQRINE
jgi:hypothetical protein